MISNEHQRLVNELAKVLESRRGVTITAIDMRGTRELFELRYRDLPVPTARNGRTPDLEGKDTHGTNHLGEAETDMNAENLDEQLTAFSVRTMNDIKAPVLHVIVPERIRSQMDTHLVNMRQAGQLGDGVISVWHMRGW